jgi:anti-sigma B factor antagonist
MKLEITTTEDGFRLEGELDMATAGGLTDLLRTTAESDDPIVLDFSGVTFMDSSGLRALLQAARSDDCGPVVVKDPSAQVRRLLEISIPEGVPGLRVRPASRPSPPAA